MINKEEDSNFW